MEWLAHILVYSTPFRTSFFRDKRTRRFLWATCSPLAPGDPRETGTDASNGSCSGSNESSGGLCNSDAYAKLKNPSGEIGTCGDRGPYRLPRYHENTPCSMRSSISSTLRRPRTVRAHATGALSPSAAFASHNHDAAPLIEPNVTTAAWHTAASQFRNALRARFSLLICPSAEATSWD